MSLPRFFFLLLSVIVFLTANAQYEEKDFVRYTIKDGLSDNYITSLQQDEKGYVWISADIGLNRFDGHSFTTYYRESQELPLLSNAIRKLKRFGNDQLGIIGRNGFQLINTNDLSFKNYLIPDSTAFSTYRNAAWDVIQLPDHSLAMTTASGIYAFDKNGKIIFRHDAYQLEDIGKKRILYGRDFLKLNEKEYFFFIEENGLASYDNGKRLLHEIGTGNEKWKIFSRPTGRTDDRWVVKQQLNDDDFIFISSLQDSIFLYDHNRPTLIASPLNFRSYFEMSWESKIAVLDDSTFAINGGSYGFFLFHLDRHTGKIISDGKKLLPAHKITCLFFDKDKRLWIGTNEGLLQQKLESPLMSAWRFPPLPGEILTGGFTCTYRYKNNLYAGRYSLNKGLLIIDPVSMQVKKRLEFYGGNNGWNEIYSMEMYHPDTLWLGTNGGILWLDTRNDSYGKVIDKGLTVSVTTLAPIRTDGYAWMCGSLNGVLARYHIASRSFTFFTSATKPALPFDNIKSVVYDSYGDVWVSGHSLTRWNNKLQSFDTLITVYGGNNKFYEDILAITADNNGSLWLHNVYNGLLEYKINQKKFIAYSRKDGLPSDVLQSFSPVIDDILWIESSNSLIRFDTRTKKITVYDYNDGMPESKPSGRRMWFDAENHLLYMCSNEYLVRFPVQPAAPDNNSSGLLLQKITVNNSNTFFLPGASLKLKHTASNILINYTIIDFEKNNYQFAYKLNNDKNWTALGEQRSFMLNNLSPGKYSIQLKATGKSGDEKETAFSFTIQPPFWKTTWFTIVCIIAIATLLYFIYRYRIGQVRQKANIDKLLAQTEMKALHSQMNPHFIFNSLNSIKEMILNNENKEASHYLSKFAQLIRMTLDQSGQSFISLRNTLDYLHRYVEMEKIRNAHFTCSIDTDNQLDMDETVLPPMLIQPFIENAIWHGVTGNNRNIHIAVNFKKENDYLVCTIDDNGVGIDQSMTNRLSGQDLHHPFGISNIRNRIRLLNEKYDQQSSVTIIDKKNNSATTTGTVVTLHLPLEINEE